MNGFPRLLKTSLRVLAALSALSMVITKELDPVFIGMFFCFFMLGFATEKKEQLSRNLGRIQPLLAFLFFLIALADFFYLSKSFLLSVAHFLLSLQGLRLLTLRTVRDSLGSVLLSSMMLLSSSTLSVDWSFFVALSLFLPLAVWCLILTTLVLDHQEIAVFSNPTILEKERRRVSAGLSEMGFPEEKQPAWSEALPVARRSTVVAFTAAGIFSAVVFLVFPRLNFRGFHGQFLQPVHHSGFTSQVDLRKGAAIFEDESVAMRVEVDPKDRELWPGYLRGSALRYFDGRIWSRGLPNQQEAFYGVHGLFRPAFDPQKRTRVIHQVIYLESMDTPVLFMAAVPSRLWVDRPSVLIGSDGTFERWRNDTWRLRYEVESRVPERMADAMAFSAAFSSMEEVALCRQLPRDFQGDVLEPLAVKAAGNATDPLLKAERIAAFLRSEYQYTLDLRDTKGDRLLEDFLLRTKKGNCEYFASAMCVLLRMSGIPSRVVTGFRAHEWNERGKYFVVRMKDAHAWVEVYAAGSWRTFDPTPRSFGNTVSGPEWMRHLNEVTDYLNLRWNRYVLSYDMERQVGVLEEIGQTSRQWTVGADGLLSRFQHFFDREGDGPRWRISRAFKWGWLVLALLSVGLFLYQRRRKANSAPWFYLQLLNLLKKRGHRKLSGQTLNEFLETLRPSLGRAWDDARTLSEAYHAVRFGGGSSPSEDGLRDALHRLSR